MNGYRLKICRLAETAGQVKLTLTVTKKNGKDLDTRYTQTKELGIITVTPLKPSELAAELALLEKAKANFFAGINDDQNISADAVTKNLHAFHEARLDADGKLIWVYTSDETLGTGIVPTDLPGYDSMGTQPGGFSAAATAPSSPMKTCSSPRMRPTTRPLPSPPTSRAHASAAITRPARTTAATRMSSIRSKSWQARKSA